MRNSPLHRQRQDAERRDAQLRSKAEKVDVPAWAFGIVLVAAAALVALM